MLTATIQSGIDVIDQRWDGLARGAAYLLYGRARSGRDLVAMQIAAAAAAFEERCVFVSPRHPRELARQAAPTGFDLEAACAEGTVRLLRTPTSLGEGDEAIEQALDELLALVQRTGPDRLVIEDFTPFVLFREADCMQRALRSFFEAIADTETTAVIGLGEPASPSSQEIVDALRRFTAGAVHLAFDDADATARRLTLLPPPGALDAPSEHAWDLARLKPSGLAAAAALFDEPEPEDAPAMEPVAEPIAEPVPVPSQVESARPADTHSGDGAILPAAIHFFDLDTPRLDAPAPDADPFAGLSTALLEKGHLVEGAPAEPVAEPAVEQVTEPVAAQDATRDPFELAEIELAEVGIAELDIIEQPCGAAETDEYEVPGDEDFAFDAAPPQIAPARMESAELDKTPYEADDAAWCSLDALAPDAEPDDAPPAEEVAPAARFAQAFDAARAEARPFLALALRTDDEPVLAALAAALADALADDGVLIAEPQRLAVMLPGREAADAQVVFRALRDRLAATPGLDAAAALRAVTAVVAPDGRPFADADAFLAHALGA